MLGFSTVPRPMKTAIPALAGLARRATPGTLATLAAIAALTLAVLSPGAGAAQEPGRDRDEIVRLTELAELRHAEGNFEEAAELYHRLARIHRQVDSQAAALVNAAWLEHRLGRDEKAEQTLIQALVLQPKYSFRPDFYTREFVDLFYEAERAALERRARLADRKTVEGVERLERGDLAAARARFQEALDLNPNHPPALFNLALVDLREDRREAATDRLQRILSLVQGPDAERVTEELRRRSLRVLGRLYFSRGLYQDAAATLERALALESDDFDSWINLGLARFELGEVEGSITALRRSLALEPESLAAIQNLTRIYASAEQWRDVEATAADGVRRHPESADLWLALGQARRHLGSAAGAIDALERVVELDPDNRLDLARQAAALLTDEYLKLGRPDAVIMTARKQLRWSPDDVTAWSHLGLAQQSRGDLEAAVESHRRAYEIDPSQPELSNNLGAALAARGDYRKAVEAYQRALALRPGFPIAAQNVQEIRERLAASVARLGIVLVERRGAANDPPGALVSEVEKRSLAARAKLKPADIIQRAGGEPIRDAEDFRYFAAGSHPAGRTTLEVLRKGRPKRLLIEMN